MTSERAIAGRLSVIHDLTVWHEKELKACEEEDRDFSAYCVNVSQDISKRHVLLLTTMAVLLDERDRLKGLLTTVPAGTTIVTGGGSC